MVKDGLAWFSVDVDCAERGEEFGEEDVVFEHLCPDLSRMSGILSTCPKQSPVSIF
jgi:hypothetical protein